MFATDVPAWMRRPGSEAKISDDSEVAAAVHHVRENYMSYSCCLRKARDRRVPYMA